MIVGFFYKTFKYYFFFPLQVLPPADQNKGLPEIQETIEKAEVIQRSLFSLDEVKKTQKRLAKQKYKASQFKWFCFITFVYVYLYSI